MPTLYVTDLDGTLLNRQAELSPFTLQTVNRLLAEGVLFSYATARSLISAQQVTRGLSGSFPVVVNNGAFIRNCSTGEILAGQFFSPEECRYAREIFLQCGVYPLVYSLVGGTERVSHLSRTVSCEMQRYLDSRRGDPRMRAVDSIQALYEGNPFYFNCIGPWEQLIPVYEIFRREKQFHCIFDVDLYSGDDWCEIMPAGTTKANGILRLKQMLGCDRVVCFGDALNDLSMFKIAEECYAVENAKAEVKAAADAVIGSNEQDGVADWLQKHAV